MMVQTFSKIQDEFFRYVGDIVYATMATVDAKGRPRARILIAVWEVVDGRLVGWLATFKTPVKTAHLAGNPHATFSYWDRRQNAAFADTVAAWVEDPKVKQRVWELYRRGSPPRGGYDPGQYWRGPADPNFAVLRLDPWRVQVVRGADLRSRIWSAETNRRAPAIPIKGYRKVMS
jgi:general stress protein 26